MSVKKILTDLTVTGAVTAPSFTGTLNGNATTATQLPTCYISGVQNNPQTYFGQGVGLKVAMTGFPSVWADTIWINGYSGGDVLSMCALHTLRNGQPRMYISSQNSNATAYGTTYEVLSTYNYNSFSPTLAGAGATGTWGINITGNAGTASNSSLLGGYAPSNNAGANTIVQRDANGYVFNNYFNTTSGGMERNASGMGYFAGFNGSDTYIRSYTPAAVAAAISNQSMNINGNAVNLSTTRNTWNTNGTISAVVGQLAWKNYGNNHTIFDASAGSAPDGTAVNNTNATNAWTGTYPTLMGWNGTSSYGVRVDSARLSDYVTVSYNNDTNSTFQMLWGSGNGVYGTGGIYCNPSTDAIYAAAIYSTSDIRYKDITEKQYQNIEDLEAISYTWKDKAKGEKIQVGYSAQEVQKYIPDAVSEDENGYLSVNYIQVLIAKIESLEKRINQLENGI